MLDFDLANIYKVETKYLKRAVKRNIERFPSDFMFELTQEELDSLRCQIGALKIGERGQHTKYLPFAFTEQGVAQLSSVLNSKFANVLVQKKQELDSMPPVGFRLPEKKRMSTLKRL